MSGQGIARYHHRDGTAHSVAYFNNDCQCMLTQTYNYVSHEWIYVCP